jgi:hypothetical protein
MARDPSHVMAALLKKTRCKASGENVCNSIIPSDNQNPNKKLGEMDNSIMVQL